ncbi:hypothetical protein [Pengzhenrongella phosphoraccumulans]|uniref:hypothetical protein n=1 Tax=Pengzhenrongella phosphoraccumulans TaxID=3114394 RepID=UPI003890973D
MPDDARPAAPSPDGASSRQPAGSPPSWQSPDAVPSRQSAGPADMPAPPGRVDPRFARSARFWLRAYPRRWRAARAAEMTEVLADLAEPGATRLDLRGAADVIRSGWATRWREHPPPRAMLAYRLWDGRMPERYHPWLWDDVTGALYSVRRLWPVLFIVVVMWIDGSSYAVVGALVVWVIMVLTTRGYVRREALRRFFPPEPSIPLIFAGPSGYRYVPPARLAARPILGATALVGLTSAGAMLLASRFAAPGDHGATYEFLGGTLTLPLFQYGFPTALQVTLGAVAVALTVPVTAALLVGVPRRATGRPAQPHRTLLGCGRTARWVVAALVAWHLLLALLVSTSTGVDFTVGVPATALGSLVGPAALIGWLVIRRTEHDGGAPLALGDLAHLVGRRRRRPLEVDQPMAVWTWPDPYAIPTPAPRPTTA